MNPLPLSLKLVLFTLLAFSAACSGPTIKPENGPQLHFPNETHFARVRQLTQGGENQKAAWSADGKQIFFVHSAEGECARPYVMKTDEEKIRPVLPQAHVEKVYPLASGDRLLVSGNLGNETLNAGSKNESAQILAQSASASCEKATDKPDASFQLYTVKLDGSDPLPVEPAAPRAYNSRAVDCHNGSFAFTSNREGDPELYGGKLDVFSVAAEVSRLTRLEGFDGDAAFSPDCAHLTWAHQTRSGRSEIWVADRDGRHARQLTRTGASSGAPTFHPNGKFVVFSSDAAAPGVKRHLYKINLDGTELEQLTFADSFDDAPSFSSDGRVLVFSSKRAGALNLLAADWVNEAATPNAGAASSAPEPKSETAWVEQFAASNLRAVFAAGSYLQKVEMPSRKGGKIVASQNIVGSFGSCSPLKSPVVLTAHLDHASLKPDTSGISTLLESARLIQADRSSTSGCFVFAVLTGKPDELGGADRFLTWLDENKVRAKAYVDLDRAGDVEDNRVLVFGTESAKEWIDLLAAPCSSELLRCEVGGDGLASYTPGNAPAIHFYSGPRPSYQGGSNPMGSSSVGGVHGNNTTGVMQIAKVAASTAVRVAAPQQRLTFTKNRVLSTGSADRLAYLGIIPDYKIRRADEDGVRLSGARPGSPANKAGVLAGDALFAIDPPAGAGGKPLTPRKLRSIDDLVSSLRSLRPGEIVTLYVKRGGQTLKLPVEVGQRD